MYPDERMLSDKILGSIRDSSVSGVFRMRPAGSGAGCTSLPRRAGGHQVPAVHLFLGGSFQLQGCATGLPTQPQGHPAKGNTKRGREAHAGSAAGIKTDGRNTHNLRDAGDTTLVAETEEELKSLLMRVEESEEAGLKLSIQKTQDHSNWFHHFMANRWRKSGNCRFIFLGSKTTVDGDCSHEIKRSLLLGRKVMTNLDTVLKSRDITLLTKVCMVKAMVFPVVM